jgi:hypothetical protein
VFGSVSPSCLLVIFLGIWGTSTTSRIGHIRFNLQLSVGSFSHIAECHRVQLDLAVLKVHRWKGLVEVR